MDLYDYCQAVRRTIREVLEEFRSAKIPREYLFDLFPPLRPREFSIASSALVSHSNRTHMQLTKSGYEKNPRRIDLCIAIVRYKTKLKMPRRGVATTYLASLQPGLICHLSSLYTTHSSLNHTYIGDRIPIRIKKGLLSLPEDKETHIICIGPGTGIAPVRSIIQERTIHQCYSECIAPLLKSFGQCTPPDNTLYQGCRHATKDQHYSQEFSALADEGKIIYRVAHSRDGPPGVKRTYVQDLILQDSERVWKLIGEQNAWVYISGYVVA